MELYKLKLPFKKIKWAYQRVKRGYSDYDLGDMDIWFLETIPKMLQDFKDKNNAMPTSMFEEYLDAHKDQDDYLDDEAEKMVMDKWNKTLDRMIYCFNEANEDKCSKRNEYDYKTEKEAHLNKEKEITLYREEMLKEGFELFRKYFHNLWI